MEFRLRPDGDDFAPTPGPHRTPGAVRDAARAHRAAHPDEAVTIVVEDGTYTLDEPLVLSAADGGVHWVAAPGAHPVFSGGRRLGPWRPGPANGRDAWVTTVPEGWDFRELWVGGGRRPRPRLPLEGTYRIAAVPDITPESPWNKGQTRFAFRPGDIDPNWHNLGDIEAVVLHFWVDSHLPLAAVDAERHLVELARRSIFRLTDDYRTTGARYYLENVFEGLQVPGQWYLDRASRVLSYLPHPGEDPERIEVIAPVLTELLRLEGVADLTLEGITLSFAEWTPPEDGRGGSVQAAAGVPAAVTLLDCRDCTLAGCTVTACGTYGLEIGTGCSGIRLQGCRLTDLGAGGVKVAKGSSHSTIADSEVAHCGRIWHAGVGVLIFDSGDNAVIGNDIHDLYYTGVSVGWVWGYGPSAGARNRIEHNHIHTIGQGLLNDMGGIYNLGVSPGTVIRGNHIHDVRSDGYGGWGIYLDEGSTDVLVEDNLVYRTKTGGFHQHYGRDNTIRNNIFAFASDGQIQRTRLEEHTSFTFEGNIVCFEAGPLLHGNWKAPGAHFDRNLYFDRSGHPLDLGQGRTLAQWQALGMDSGSVVADPRFADPDHGDFTLAADSPALAIGFRPFAAGPAGGRRQRAPRPAGGDRR